MSTVFLSFGLHFQGEAQPRTAYAFAPAQANGHRFAHSLEVEAVEPGVLEVVQDGRQEGRVNRVKVVARQAATAPVHLALGPLRFVYPLQVAAPAQALLAQIGGFEIYRLRPGNLLSGEWTLAEGAVPTAPMRVVVEATDLSPLGGITAVGIEVEGQVIAAQEVAGQPSATRVSLLEQEVRAAIAAIEAQLPSVEEVLRAYEQEPGLALPEEALPLQTRLLTFPNPFNSSTQLLFHLGQASPVRLSLYNLLGQKVRTLGEGHWPAGAHQVEWDGRDEQGQAVASGIYLCRLQAGQQVETRKLLLLR